MLKGWVETISIRAAWPPRSRLTASPAAARFRAAGAVERREDEVAGVEEVGRVVLELAGADRQRRGDGGDPDAGPAQVRLQRVGAPEAFGEAGLQGVGAALQFDQAAGEPFGAAAEALQAAAEPTGRLRQLPHSGFQPPAAGDEAVEAAVDLAGDFAQPPHFVAVEGDGAGEGAGLVGRRLQRGIRGRGGFELPGQLARPGQLAAADAGQQRAQAEGQGEAADRGPALAVGEAPAAGFETPDRPGRLFAAAGGAAEFLGDQPGPGGRPFGAVGEQPAARGAGRDPTPQLLHRPRRPPQPRPEPVQLPKAGRRADNGTMRPKSAHRLRWRGTGRGGAGVRCGGRSGRGR